MQLLVPRVLLTHVGSRQVGGEEKGEERRLLREEEEGPAPTGTGKGEGRRTREDNQGSGGIWLLIRLRIPDRNRGGSVRWDGVD